MEGFKNLQAGLSKEELVNTIPLPPTLCWVDFNQFISEHEAHMQIIPRMERLLFHLISKSLDAGIDIGRW